MKKVQLEDILLITWQFISSKVVFVSNKLWVTQRKIWFNLLFWQPIRRTHHTHNHKPTPLQKLTTPKYLLNSQEQTPTQIIITYFFYTCIYETNTNIYCFKSNTPPILHTKFNFFLSRFRIQTMETKEIKIRWSEE